MSLTIEVGQVILDLLIDANRVFELDDLWTNTLGGLLALAVYRLLVKLIQTHFKSKKPGSLCVPGFTYFLSYKYNIFKRGKNE